MSDSDASIPNTDFDGESETMPTSFPVCGIFFEPSLQVLLCYGRMPFLFPKLPCDMTFGNFRLLLPRVIPKSCILYLNNCQVARDELSIRVVAQSLNVLLVATSRNPQMFTARVQCGHSRFNLSLERGWLVDYLRKHIAMNMQVEQHRLQMTTNGKLLFGLQSCSRLCRQPRPHVQVTLL